MHFERRIANTSPDSVLSATRKYFDPNKLFVVTAGDFDKKPVDKKPGTKK